MFVRLKDIILLLYVSKVNEKDFHQIFLLNFRSLNFFYELWLYLIIYYWSSSTESLTFPDFMMTIGKYKWLFSINDCLTSFLVFQKCLLKHFSFLPYWEMINIQSLPGPERKGDIWIWRKRSIQGKDECEVQRGLHSGFPDRSSSESHFLLTFLLLFPIQFAYMIDELNLFEHSLGVMAFQAHNE